MLKGHGKHCVCGVCGTLKDVGLMSHCTGKGCSHPSHKKAHSVKKKRK